MDTYRPIKLCLWLFVLWLVYVVSLGNFRSGIAAERPQYNVVDFEKDFDKSAATRPLVEIGKERGWNHSGRFVSAEKAKEIEQKYERGRWIAFGYLAVALGTASAIVFTGHSLWGSWLLGIAVVFLGPLAIAWGMSRIDTEYDQNTVVEARRADWLAISLQGIFGGFLGGLAGYCLVMGRATGFIARGPVSSMIMVGGCILAGAGIFMKHGNALLIPTRVIPPIPLRHTTLSMSLAHGLIAIGIGLLALGVGRFMFLPQ